MKFVNKIEEIFIALSLFAGVILVFVNVLLRVFNIGLSWSEELVRLLIIWMTFIGLSVVLRKSSHISIDVFPKLFKNKWENIPHIIINIFSLIFSVILIQYSIEFLMKIQGTAQTSASIGVPMYIFYIVIPISGILLLISYLFETTHLIKELIKNPRI